MRAGVFAAVILAGLVRGRDGPPAIRSRRRLSTIRCDRWYMPTIVRLASHNRK
jgi:hypothetical protein